MKKFVKIILRLIITGTFTLFIAACYGMPSDFNYITRGIWKTIKTRDEDSNPIQGLKLTNRDSNIAVYTDQDGVGSLMFSATAPEWKVFIEDVDGTEGGGEFTPQTMTLGEEDEYIITMEITAP